MKKRYKNELYFIGKILHSAKVPLSVIDGPVYKKEQPSLNTCLVILYFACWQDSHDRAELNKLFEEISSDDDDGEEAGIEGYEDADNSAGQLDEQVRLIMKEISEIQQRRQQIKKKLGSMSGSEKINLQEELSLLHSKESTKLMYLEELRSRSRSANAT